MLKKIEKKKNLKDKSFMLKSFMITFCNEEK